MKRKESVTTATQPNTEICNYCKNQDNQKASVSKETFQTSIFTQSSENENLLTKQQNYLAHIFEAQFRFGE